GLLRRGRGGDDRLVGCGGGPPRQRPVPLGGPRGRERGGCAEAPLREARAHPASTRGRHRE
ncbi:unnamed protein product, partial [Prorocentrum cordatum]